MPDLFDPRIDILPAAQQEIWPHFALARELGFVLYRGTAVALHLGHRASIDFDFFKEDVPVAETSTQEPVRAYMETQGLLVRGNTLLHRDWLKLNKRHGLRRAFASFFADWDILLCPAAASAVALLITSIAAMMSGSPMRLRKICCVVAVLIISSGSGWLAFA